MLQAQDLLDGVDLSVAIDLGHSSVAHIQQLAPAEEGTPHHQMTSKFIEAYIHSTPRSRVTLHSSLLRKPDLI